MERGYSKISKQIESDGTLCLKFFKVSLKGSTGDRFTDRSFHCSESLFRMATLASKLS